MNFLFFTYGTLMLPFPSPIAQHFHRNALFLGEAHFTGLLFDIGQYPGACYFAKCRHLVFGQLFQINSSVYTKVMELLDAYEGGEYNRTYIPIDFQSQQLEAEVYLYNQPFQHLACIPNGDYRSYCVGNRLHQNFVEST